MKIQCNKCRDHTTHEILSQSLREVEWMGAWDDLIAAAWPAPVPPH